MKRLKRNLPFVLLLGALLSCCLTARSQTYCSPTFTSTANLSCSNYYIRNFQYGGINNTPTSCSVSNYLSQVAYATPGVAKSYSITIGNYMSYAIYADFNKDGDFDDANEMLEANHPSWTTTVQTVTGNITIPASVASSTYRLRVVGIWGDNPSVPPIGAGQACATFVREGSGNFNDYTLNVSTCSGTPSAGALTSSASTVCPNTSFALSLASASLGGDISYGWQSSLTGTPGTWTTLATTSARSYTVASQAANTYYRAFASCASSGLGDTSAAITVVSLCYCTPTFISTSNLSCSNYQLRNVQIGGINNTPSTSNCTTASYTSLTATLAAGVASPYSIQLGNWMSFAIYADFNKDGDFDDANEMLVANRPAWVTAIETVTGTVTVPATIPAGTYRMRVLAVWGNDPSVPPVTSGQACATFTREGSGNYHDYTLNVTGSATPVQFGDLSGYTEGSLVRLQWYTLQEVNNTGFTLERSLSGPTGHFKPLAVVASKAVQGQSTGRLDYGFADRDAFTGKAFYRVKQTDKDGRVIYSRTISLVKAANGLTSLSVYPNPVKDVVTVSLSSAVKPASVLVVNDLAGRVLLTRRITAQTTQVDVSGLPAGIYQLLYTDGQEKVVTRLIRQ